MFVYLAPLKDETAFKIGKAQIPDRRLRALSKFYDFDLNRCVVVNVVTSEAAAYKFERFLHEMMDHLKVSQPYDGGTEFFDFEFFDATVDAVRALSRVVGFDVRLYEPPLPDSEDFEEEELSNRLSRKVRSRRLELNLSHERLAELSGVSRRVVSKIESGGNVNLTCFLQVCMTLGLDDQLLPGESEEPIRQRAR